MDPEALPAISMATFDEMLDHEADMMGRPVRFQNGHEFMTGDKIVRFMVYTHEKYSLKYGKVHIPASTRWVVWTSDGGITGGII